MSIKFKYKAPDTNAGALRTPVTFHEYGKGAGFDPVEVEKAELYDCFAEVYNPSMKDLQVMQTTGTKEAVTIRIRDTKGEYVPTNKHKVKVHDYRYLGKVFEIIEVRPDLQNNNFITILLGLSS